ncbi:MAG: hypothetical protein ACI957_005552, partial [Verrucomicrobiales bacterium]
MKKRGDVIQLPALPLVAKMIRLELTDQDLTDVAEALDDPATTD